MSEADPEYWLVVFDGDGNEVQRNKAVVHGDEVELIIGPLAAGDYVYRVEWDDADCGLVMTNRAPLTVSEGDEDGVDGSGAAQADA